MGTGIHILVEFYDEENKRWILMRWDLDDRKYEPAKVEALEKMPGETDDDFEYRWEEYYETLPIESVKRDYKLFANIANVRNEHNTLIWSLPKKFPHDVSRDAIIASEYNYPEDSLHHSHTWYTTVELQFLIMFDERELIQIVNRAYDQCPLSRLLFWFDN